VIRAVGVSVESTLTAQWGTAVANIDSAGKMIVGAFGVSELAAGDTLLNLVFKVIAEPGDSTAIIFNVFKFNNNNPVATVENGSLKILLPMGVRQRNSLTLPQQVQLVKNYPEPFRDLTHIAVHLNGIGLIEVEIYNILGQRIKQYEKFAVNPAGMVIDWNATDDQGISVPPGIYFAVVKQNNEIFGVDRMILLK